MVTPVLLAVGGDPLVFFARSASTCYLRHAMRLCLVEGDPRFSI